MQALAAGAVGYILKGNVQTIVTGIRRVLGGEEFVSAAICTRASFLSENDE